MDLQGWPTGSTAALATEPTNLLPGRIEGWPAGSQRDGTAATDLLAQAVAWWDASAYRDGDRFLRNRGIAGELLDLRLGSSVVANTNDPTWLGPDATGYVYLPGVASNYLSVPDENALDITGDIDIRVRVALDNWIPSANQDLLSKFDTGTGQRSYSFFVDTAGRPGLFTSTDGSAGGVVVYSPGSATGFQNGSLKWLRVTLDVAGGSLGGYDAKFYTSDDGTAWTQLGSTASSASNTSIFAGTASVTIGARNNGALQLLTGKVYRAQVLNGIDGTTVLDVDCDAITSGSATSFTCATGQTCTINRSTSGRKSVAVPARRLGGRPCFLLGTDDYFEVPAESVWQQQLANFYGGDTFTIFLVNRQWTTFNGTYITNRLIAADVEAGWVMRASASSVTCAYSDGAAFTSMLSPARTSGDVVAMALVKTLGPRFGVQYVNNVVRQTADTTTGSLFSQTPVRIGRRSSTGTDYADMEFRAAAIFRRSLSATDIALLTTYYSGG